MCKSSHIERGTYALYPIKMDDFLKKFGARIRSYRQSSGFSQEKLAELANVSTNTICTIENGKTFITYQTLKNISNVLNIQIPDLFDFATKEKNQDKLLQQIVTYAKLLSPAQKKQIIGILKTFKV